MKYIVTVEQQIFEVEIKDIHAHPVIAIVDGEPIEIWPEIQGLALVKAVGEKTTSRPGPNGKPNGNPARTPGNSGKKILSVVRAPIPGVIIAVNVQSGDEVEAGQQLCVLEAMKMNNSIRSSRTGRIAVVHVSVGQQVKHSQPLVEFEE